MTLPVFPGIYQIKWDSTKTPSWDTTVKRLGRGKRKSITNRAYPDWEINVQFVGLTKAQADEIIGFLGVVCGGAFRWWDLEDNTQQGMIIGIGDGSTTAYQLMRQWGGTSFVEPVLDPLADTVKIYAAGTQLTTGWSLAEDGGIQFDTAPAAGTKITADFSYYWRVAIDKDVELKNVFTNLYEFGKMKLVSV